MHPLPSPPILPNHLPNCLPELIRARLRRGAVQAATKSVAAAATAVALAAWATLVAPAAQAGPLVLASYDGSGNADLFDPVTGSGGWTGRIDEQPDPAVARPLALVSVVLFQYDALARTLSGQFEFTRSADLGASLFGRVTGSTQDADIFGSGGQFALDYTVLGGTGDYAGFSGYGLSFLTIDPTGQPDNYGEVGLLALAAPVPEPGMLPLLAAALLGLALTGQSARRRKPVA